MKIRYDQNKCGFCFNKKELPVYSGYFVSFWELGLGYKGYRDSSED